MHSLVTGALPAELAGRAEDLAKFLEIVREFNARMDLTAARTDEDLVDLAVADAAVLAQRVPRDASVVDVGSGFGAPGLTLSIARPDLSVTLVEPMDKRVMFLRTAIGKLGIENVRVERKRGEDLVGRATFDVAISRATLAPKAWLELGRKLAPRGEVWVLLAGEALEEDTAGASALDYTWPFSKARRRAVRFR